MKLQKWQCKRCRFWDGIGDDVGYGICRRHAPIPATPHVAIWAEAIAMQMLVSHGTDVDAKESYEACANAAKHDATWPQTLSTDWCGDFHLANQ